MGSVGSNLSLGWLVCPKSYLNHKRILITSCRCYFVYLNSTDLVWSDLDVQLSETLPDTPEQ